MIQTENKFLVCGKPDIGPSEEKAVIDVLRSGWLGYGSVAKDLEKEFAFSIHVDESIAVGSATIGLILALKASGIGPGDRVITSPLTFAATVNAILAVGATPVFADVKLDGTIDPFKIVFTEKTKAVIPVHLWGIPCDLDKIIPQAREHKAVVIEDAAHAYGGFFWGRQLGTLGDFGVFSFYPTKNLASCDGGMVVGENKKALERIRLMAAQGLGDGAWARYSSKPVKEYEVASVGLKGLMNDVSAAIAREQLHRWNELRRKREAIFTIYEEAFGLRHPESSQHIYEIRVPNRDHIRHELFKRGIGTGVHYNPLHLEPAYSFLGHKRGDFPVTEKIGAETMTLPISTTMTESDANRVVEAIKEIRGERK